MNFKNLVLISSLLFIFVGSAIAQEQNTQERTVWPPLESGVEFSGLETSIGRVKIMTTVNYRLLGNPCGPYKPYHHGPYKPYCYSYVLTNTGKVDIFVDWETLNFLFDGPFGGPLFFKLKKGESRDFFFYSDQKPVKTAGSLKILAQDGKFDSIFDERYSLSFDDFLPKVQTSKSKKNILVFVSGGLATAYFPRDLWFEIKEIRDKYEKSR